MRVGLDFPEIPLFRRDSGVDILQNAEYYPSRMAEFAGQWKEMGAQILGGCCASGPEHIAAMAPVVKG